MAKIIVLAQGEDAEKAKAALDTAGLDFQIVGPTAANLLNIVIGIVGGGSDEPEDEGEPEEKAEEPVAPDEPEVAKPATDDSSKDASGDSEVSQESKEPIGSCLVDGEEVKVFVTKAAITQLVVPKMMSGARTTYNINESAFTFWPSDPAKPTQRVSIEQKHRTNSVEVELVEGTSSYLLVGTDLLNLFK